jgi:cellobiose phosphorylase
MDYLLNNKGFLLETPQRNRSWYNYISNAQYGIKISHLADGYATTLEAPRVAVTNYDFFAPIKGRYVYVSSEGEVWNPSYAPSCTELDSYKCLHEPGATSWISSKKGLQVENTVFVPREGAFELELIKVTNTQSKKVKCTIYTETEFLLYNSFGVDPVYYSWYTDSQADEDFTLYFERRGDGDNTTGFSSPLVIPTGFETSLKRFYGGGDWTKPDAVVKNTVSNAMSGGDPYIAAFQYELELEANQTLELGFITGAYSSKTGKDFVKEAKSRFPSVKDIEEELQAIRKLWSNRLHRYPIEKLQSSCSSVSKEQFADWVNTFMGYQVYQQSLGMVRGTFRGFRDVAQDAMALCYYEPEKAKELLIDLCTRQYSSGRCLRQWNTEGGANDERDFRDLPFWILGALHTYHKCTHDSSIYTETAIWQDSDTKSTLWEHGIKGIEYALQYQEDGLIKMGIGDWNDALSGPGVNGGSVFLNQIAYWALSIAEDLQNSLGLTVESNSPVYCTNIPHEKEKLYSGVMKFWNNKWFARAVTEKGTVIGDTEERNSDGRFFLLPQAWFIISGMYKHSSDSSVIGTVAINTMLEKLETEIGLLKVNPGYTFYTPISGNLSALAPGMAENFAIYNHAAAFASYALFMLGRKEDGWRILDKILPFTKDWKKTKAEPYVLVNFYNGGFYKEKKGEGGVPWLTGTVNWVALILNHFIIDDCK